MPKANLRRGLSVAALAAVAVLAACSTPEPAPAPVVAPPPPPPPPVTLNEGVAQAASIYVAFIREVGTIQAGFPDAESIQVAIRRGAAYEPAQLSRGMIAYGSILALQSPEFVAGVRTYAADPVQRREVIDRIIADPAYAATLPGADAAAGLIIATLGKDITTMTAIAEAVEADAYTIQERRDPRRRWAVTHIPNREVRLESTKSLSAAQMLPSAEESSRLFAAAHAGGGLNLEATRATPPYTPAVINSLAIAALAALGAGGDDYRANTEALTVESNSEFCLNMSKLNLFQCLAASRPSYEDMFCMGRHIVRDLATCTTEATVPRVVSLTPTAVAGGQGQSLIAADATAASAQAVRGSGN
ncbi:hypothetical protein [Brevundimonas sp.]|uniref:hypothetical protein n=1 Tax=Brevundimonas sp. TaxID=1871086 RepID=UPI002AB7FB45|nr:hypothetical protein [Brevundimonas sp.]MDZ4364167.1 hypothetical protein [Brevundimonas sp.]